MLSILFWQRSSARNKKGEAPLMVRLTLSSEDKTDFASGHKVNVKLWNKEKKLFTGKSLEAARANVYMAETKSRLHRLYYEMAHHERLVSAELLKYAIKPKKHQAIAKVKTIKTSNKTNGENEKDLIQKIDELSARLTQLEGRIPL